MTYLFNKEAHIHTLDGTPLHGVTTVLQVISKPALIQWAANMAVDYIAATEFRTKDTAEELWERLQGIFKEARTAHRKKKEKAGDWGSELHEAIENWIKTKAEPSFEGTQKVAFENFKNWCQEHNVVFLESEKHVWSESMWVGGICDLVFTMDGKKYIGDIKTSSRIYNEHFFQMAAYDLCLTDMGEHQDVAGYIVINLKKDGEIDLMRADNMKLNREAFLAALTLHKIINSLK